MLSGMVTGIHTDEWLRAARRAREVSQRELVDLSGVGAKTISDLESGRRPPQLSTLVRLLGALEYRLQVVDLDGVRLEVDDDYEVLVDRAGRHFPAHLRCAPTPPIADGHWWGYYRIAWWSDDPVVPSHTYWRRQSWAISQDPWRPRSDGQVD